MLKRFSIALLLPVGLAAGFASRPAYDKAFNPAPNITHEVKVSAFGASTATADVVMLGDSLTQWGEWSELIPDKRVSNRGIAGDTVQMIHGRLDSVYSMKPKTVVVMMGTNNINRSESVESIATSYATVIDDIIKHRINVVIGLTPKASKAFKYANQFNTKVDSLNTAIAAAAAERKINTFSIDDGIDDLTGYRISDGLHLNGAAYAKFGQHVDKALKTIN